MRHALPLTAVLLAPLVGAALLPSCAIVDEISTGFRAAGRFLRGEGRVEHGQQQGEWTYLREDGQVRARGRYEDDVAVGPWTYYYANGQKEYEGELDAKGVRTGRYTYWHPNGSPRATGSFEDGREFGEWMFWGPRGNLVQRGSFLDGLRTGLWTAYAADGRVASRGLYHAGEQVGRWTLAGADGEDSIAWTPMPDGVEWIVDRWDDGTPRRTGFRERGRQAGLWTLHDRTGDPRLVLTFDNGVAAGPCIAYGPGLSVIAEGQAANDRATGPWQIAVGGAPQTIDASGFAPAMPFTGTWSDAGLVNTVGTEAALGIWIAELGAPIDDTLVQDHAAPEEGGEAEKAELAAASPEPDVPVVLQPWTESELDSYTDLVDAFRGGGRALEKLRSKYARMRRRPGKTVPQLGGDTAAAARYVGKPLPLTVFKTTDGSDLDLGDLKGKRVVLVVLRGYAGGVCEYCVAQTKAWSIEGAPEEIERLGAELYVLFPGEANGLATFLEAYQQLNENLRPPYKLLYENDYIVGPMMEIEGRKVIPSTFVLDEEGVCRFAYVGLSTEDRPSAELVIDALEDIAREDAPANTAPAVAPSSEE